MKKIAAVIAAFFLFSACSSTPKEAPFSVDLKSPRYEAGAAEAYLTGMMSIGGLKKNDIAVFYYPVEDAVCLQFNIQLVRCNQFWDRDGREAFATALERYREEYEQRKLVKSGKSREAYGAANGFFMWKKTALSVQAHGNAKVKLGYQFKDKGVFFTTTQMEAKYEDPIARSRNQTSPVTVMYFTRSQAEGLATLFSQEHLRGLGPRLPGSGGAAQSEIDEY